MINRLQEFHQLGKKNRLEPGRVEAPDEEKILEDRELIIDLLPNAKKAIAKLQIMSQNNQIIHELKKKQKKEIRGEEEKQYSEELGVLVRESQSHQNFIKTTIDDMKLDVADARKEIPDEPEWRVIIGIYSAVVLRFREVLREFQEYQLDYKNATREKIKRQIAIVKPNADEDEVNELVNDPEAVSKLVSEQIAGNAHPIILNAIEDIDWKYQDIIKLGTGIDEIYQLFLDLGTLISAQGEMLNSILTNMTDAKNYIKKANEKLNCAQRLHKKTQSKMCWILIIVVVILVILLVTVLGVSFSV